MSAVLLPGGTDSQVWGSQPCQFPRHCSWYRQFQAAFSQQKESWPQQRNLQRHATAALSYGATGGLQNCCDTSRGPALKAHAVLLRSTSPAEPCGHSAVLLPCKASSDQCCVLRCHCGSC